MIVMIFCDIEVSYTYFLFKYVAFITDVHMMAIISGGTGGVRVRNMMAIISQHKSQNF